MAIEGAAETPESLTGARGPEDIHFTESVSVTTLWAVNEVKYYGSHDPYRRNLAREDSCGGWIGTPGDLTAFFVHIDGFKDTDQLLSDDTLRVMTTSSAANPLCAKGLFMDSRRNNWWNTGLLDGTTTVSVRTWSLRWVIEREHSAFPILAPVHSPAVSFKIWTDGLLKNTVTFARASDGPRYLNKILLHPRHHRTSLGFYR